MQDDEALTALERGLAVRLRAERQARDWSLSDLAARSGVSRAMISKVERAEASPTAALLGRLSGAFGLTVSALLARAEGDASSVGRIMRSGAQPIWRDPATGYLRRAVSPLGADPELVHVELPPKAYVSYPAAAYTHLRSQSVWMLGGSWCSVKAQSNITWPKAIAWRSGLPRTASFTTPQERHAPTWLSFRVCINLNF
jgi:transcriptional regulator with XRE-family HTH domain